MSERIVLVVRRTIRASAERIFDAWTQPEHLMAWWGPKPVTCSSAGVDLRTGGKYRIVNALPDGNAVTIATARRRPTSARSARRPSARGIRLAGRAADR